MVNIFLCLYLQVYLLLDNEIKHLPLAFAVGGAPGIMLFKISVKHKNAIFGFPLTAYTSVANQTRFRS